MYGMQLGRQTARNRGRESGCDRARDQTSRCQCRLTFMRHKFRLLSAFTVASACSGQLSATNRVLGLGFVIPHILLRIVVCKKKKKFKYISSDHLATGVAALSAVWLPLSVIKTMFASQFMRLRLIVLISLQFPISLFAFCIFLSHFPPWFAYTLAMGFVQFHINFFSMRLHANQYHKENTIYGLWKVVCCLRAGVDRVEMSRRIVQKVVKNTAFSIWSDFFPVCVFFCFGGHKKTNKLHFFLVKRNDRGSKLSQGGRRLGKYTEN